LAIETTLILHSFSEEEL